MTEKKIEGVTKAPTKVYLLRVTCGDESLRNKTFAFSSSQERDKFFRGAGINTVDTWEAEFIK